MMNNQDDIYPIVDKIEEKRLRAIVDDIVGFDFIIKSEWLANMGWIAIPVESAAHFDEHDVELIANACTERGYPELYAIALDDLGTTPHCYHLATTMTKLMDFSKKFSYLNFALITDDISFLILCTTADYFVIASDKTFVEMATGKNVEKARADFAAFAQSSEWDEFDKIRLSAISEIYS